MRLTSDAVSMIQALALEQALPEGAGLRIHQRDDHDALAMEMAAAPEPGDEVIRLGEVQVFLAPIARRRLVDATLDARVNEMGSAFFLQP
jgi:Fe-S cluster assembly iron-binding protein IscA